jgi:hypothetical protein
MFWFVWYKVDDNGDEVRKEVEISAYSVGTGESFVEGFSASQHARRAFDKPLASALPAGLDYSHPSRAAIPMLPNGTPGLSPKSFRNSICIRKASRALVLLLHLPCRRIRELRMVSRRPCAPWRLNRYIRRRLIVVRVRGGWMCLVRGRRLQ